MDEEMEGYQPEGAKLVLPDTELLDEDPQYMTLEEDGQSAFDRMWEEGSTVTPDGYVR